MSGFKTGFFMPKYIVCEFHFLKFPLPVQYHVWFQEHVLMLCCQIFCNKGNSAYFNSLMFNWTIWGSGLEIFYLFNIS